jgi:hypothetical protein
MLLLEHRDQITCGGAACQNQCRRHARAHAKLDVGVQTIA